MDDSPISTSANSLSPVACVLPAYLSISTMSSQSAPVYVPVHRRTGSASSSSSVAHPYIYSVDALLALAPPSHIHGTDAHSPSSSPNTKSGQDAELHQGWTNLNTAYRNYLRAACPEIAMNRKMRKALEFHQFHSQRTASRQNATYRDEKKHSSRGSSRSSRSSSPSVSEAEDRARLTVPKRHGAPSQISAEGLRRSHSPNQRRVKARQATPSHAPEDNWRTVTRHGIVPSLPVIAVA